MLQVVRFTRPGGRVGYVGVAHGVHLPGEELFYSLVHLQVRRFLPEVVDLIVDRTSTRARSLASPTPPVTRPGTRTAAPARPPRCSASSSSPSAPSSSTSPCPRSGRRRRRVWLSEVERLTAPAGAVHSVFFVRRRHGVTIGRGLGECAKAIAALDDGVPGSAYAHSPAVNATGLGRCAMPSRRGGRRRTGLSPAGWRTGRRPA